MDEISSNSMTAQRTQLNLDNADDGMQSLLGVTPRELETGGDCLKFLKQKLDDTNLTLQVCEQSKLCLQRQNEKLRRECDENAGTLRELQLKLELLTEKCRMLEGQRNLEKDKGNKEAERLQILEEEVLKQRASSRNFEEKYKENLALLEQERANKRILEQDYETFVDKTAALEDYSKALIEAQSLCELKNKKSAECISRKDAAIKESKENIKQLKKDVSEYEKEILEMKNIIQDLKMQLKESTENYQALKERLCEIRDSSVSKTDLLQDECQMLNMRAQKSESDCKKYFERIEEQDRGLEELRRKRNESESQIQALKGVIDGKNEELCQSLSESRAGRERIQELEDQIAEERLEIQELREMVTTERTKNATQENKYAEKTKECQILATECENLEGIIRSCERELTSQKELNEESRKLKEDNTAMLAEIEAMKKRDHAKEAEIANLESRLGKRENMKEELRKLRNKSKQMEAELSAANEALSSSDHERSLLAKQIDELMRVIENLKREKSFQEDTVLKLQKMVEELQMDGEEEATEKHRLLKRGKYSR